MERAYTLNRQTLLKPYEEDDVFCTSIVHNVENLTEQDFKNHWKLL